MNNLNLRLLVIFSILATATVAIAAGVSTSPTSNITTPASTTNTNTPKRLKITLTVSDPSEVKVKEGDLVTKGQVLADKDKERVRLDRERREALLAIANIERQSTLTLKPAVGMQDLPPISFAIEESRIQQAELEFSQAQRNLQSALENDPFITARARSEKAKSGIESAYRKFELQQQKLNAVNGLQGLPPEMIAHETEKLRERKSEVDAAQAEYDFYTAEYKQVESARNATVADLQSKIQMARANLEITQASLRGSKEQREYAEYNHRVTLARRAEEENQAAIAVSNQKLDRIFKLAQLRENLSATEEKLNGIVQVKSPYAGTIQRVKSTKQTDGKLSFTVYLLPSITSTP